MRYHHELPLGIPGFAATPCGRLLQWVALWLLLAPAPGCLWGPALVVGIVASQDDSGSDLPPVPTLNIELVEPGQPCPPDATPPLEDGWREGPVAFKVELRPPTQGGTHCLKCYSLQAGRREEVPVRVYRRDGPPDDAQAFLPVDCTWSIPPDLPEPGETRWCVWNSQEDDITGEVALRVEWGGARSTSQSFIIDNSLVPTVEIVSDPTTDLSQSVFEPLDCTEPDSGFMNTFTVKFKLSGCDPPGDSATPAEGPVTLEVAAHVVSEEEGGEVVIPVETAGSESIPCVAGVVHELQWDSTLFFPDDRVKVLLEVTPRQLKLGDPQATEWFIVDNRKPRPVHVTPQVFPSDSSFHLIISGEGFSWPGEDNEGTVIWLLPRDKSAVKLLPHHSVPEDPEHDEWLQGPTSLEVDARSEELGLLDHVGPLDICVQNPNGRSTLLPAWVSVGPSRSSDIGPFYRLEGEPLEVAIGHFVPDGAEPPDPALEHPDVAVIYGDRPAVKLFGGDGTGTFPEQWIVSLTSPNPRPMALAPVPLGDGRTGALVATPDTVELLSAGPERGKFSSRVVMDGLAPETDARDLVVHDFNGDGVPDLAVSGYFQSIVEVFLGTGLGDEMQWPHRTSPFYISSVRSLAAADFTLDEMGWADLVVLGEQGGIGTLFLHFSVGNSGFTPEPWASLQLPEDARLVTARDDASFNSGDSIPDLHVTRNMSGLKVLVGWNKDERHWYFEKQTRESAPLGRDPRGLAIVQLPRNRPAEGDNSQTRILWDTALVGQEYFNCAYSDPDGVTVDSKRGYLLPGQARGLAMADVNHDGIEDAVAVSSDPPALTVLLANRPCEVGEGEPDYYDVQAEPFHYPLGCFAGENPALDPDVSGQACGRVGPETDTWFIVTHDTNTAETVIRLVDPRTLAPLGEHRYLGLGDRVPQVADLDLDGADDLVIPDRSEGTIDYVRNEGGAGSTDGRLFPDKPEPGFVLDLASLDESVIPLDLWVLMTDPENPEMPMIRRLAFANLDDNPYPEIVAPLTVDGPEDDPATIENERFTRDYVVVLFNVADPARETLPPSERIRFYRTADDPRHVVVANINGDAALDLALACEGQDATYGNCVHLLFGNPKATGQGSLFFDSESSGPDIIPPVTLKGYENHDTAGKYGPWEVEFVEVDSRPPDPSTSDARLWRRSTWIIVSNNRTVSAYAMPPDGLDPADPTTWPEAEVIVNAKVGVDPENILVADLCPGMEGLEAIVTDEDGHRLYLIHSENTPGLPRRWVYTTIPTGRTPKGLSLLGEERDNPHVCTVTAGDREIEIYEREASGCGYSRVKRVSLDPPEKSGGTLGLSVWRDADGAWLVASVVEDHDSMTKDPAVDLLSFPQDSSREKLVEAGAAASTVARHRKCFPGILTIQGILIGDVVGDAARPDLILAGVSGDGRSTEVLCCRDLEGYGEVSGGPCVAVEGEGLSPCLELPDATAGLPLVDWDLLGTRGPVTWVVAATSRGVYLLEIDRESGQGFIRSQTPSGRYQNIVQIAARNLRGEDSGPGDSFVAVMQEHALAAETFPFNEPLLVWEDTQSLGAVGVSDLDDDGLDDVVVVNALESTLNVFLAQDPRGRSFGPRASESYFEFVSPVELCFLDRNGDGVRDVALAGRDGSVLTFLGNRDGSFRGTRGAYSGPNVEALRAVDFDGDGRGELLVSGAVPGLVILAPQVETRNEALTTDTR